MLQHVTIDGNDTAHCNGIPESMPSWWASLLGKVPAAQSRAAAAAPSAAAVARDDTPASVSVEHPWVAHFLKGLKTVQSRLVPDDMNEDPDEFDEEQL